MSMTDPIADLLTRIRNANSIGSRKVKAPYSELKKNILKILKEQGYIVDYDPQMDESKGVLNIELKFGPDGAAITVNPGAARPYHYMGRLLLKNRLYEPAGKAFANAFRLNPRSVSSYNFLLA